MPRRFPGAWQGPGEVRREAVLLSPAPPRLRWRLPELWRCGCAARAGVSCWGAWSAHKEGWLRGLCRKLRKHRAGIRENPGFAEALH